MMTTPYTTVRSNTAATSGSRRPPRSSSWPAPNSSKPMMQDEIMPPIVAPVATCTTQLTSGGARMTLYRPPAAADATTKRAKSWSLWSVLRVNLKASALCAADVTEIVLALRELIERWSSSSLERLDGPIDTG